MRILKSVLMIGLLVMLLPPCPGMGASPTITASPYYGPPTTVVTVKGGNFGFFELVDIYLDETPVKVVGTDSTGAFGGWAAIKVTVPKAATPDTYYFTAVGRKSGLYAQTTFVVCTDWAQFRFDNWHKGYNPYENLISPANVADLEQWFSLPTGAALDASPTVTSPLGIVCVASRDGKVRVTKPNSGIGWSTTIKSTGGAIYATPAVLGSRAYVGSTDGKLWTWDYSTDQFYVTATLVSAIYAAPTVTASGVFVAAVNGKVYKYKPAALNISLWATPGSTGGAIYASPTVANGLVYVASGDGKLYAFNNTSGAALWNVPLCVGVAGLASTPAVSNGLVYVGAPNKNLYALNAQNGAHVWTFLAGGAIYSSPALANGRLYFGAIDGYLYCLDAAYGFQNWKVYAGAKVYSSPAVANGVVYVGTDAGKVLAYNAATGARLWSAQTNGMVRSSPVVANGTLYVTSNDTRLYAYRIDSGGLELSQGGRVKKLRPDPGTLVPNPDLKLE